VHRGDGEGVEEGGEEILGFEFVAVPVVGDVEALIRFVRYARLRRGRDGNVGVASHSFLRSDKIAAQV